MIDSSVIEQALSKIGNYGAGYLYFFQNLKSADWIEPLWKAGFFRHPPPAERDGNSVAYPPWVESQYLARMADLSPEVVAKVIEAMEETENVRVHRDVIEVAAKLPPAVAGSLVTKIGRFLRHTNTRFIDYPLAKFVQNLVIGGEIDAALTLLRAVLAFLPDGQGRGETVPGSREKEMLFGQPEPKPIWDVHEYQEILKKGVRALLKHSPSKALELSSETLNKGLELAFREDKDALREGNDSSVSWRPAVEEHDQNNDFYHKALLVPIIRDSCISFLERNPSAIDELGELLGRFKWDIFKRIYIHVCRVCPDSVGPERIQALLTDDDLFDNYRYQHEWSLLLSEQFKNLSLADKELILNRIDNGFDGSSAIAYHKQRFGEHPTDQLIEGWKIRWQRDKLCFIEADLPSDWKLRYSSFLAKVGEPEHPGFPVWSSGVLSGSRSPKTPEQLLAMPVADLMQYLGEWQPSGEWLGDSVAGLASTLETAVKSDPDRFSEKIHDFQALRPDYIRGLISGFSEAAKSGKAIPWHSLLHFCQWVLGQNPGRESVAGEPEEDRDWRWARMEVVRLISAGLKGPPGEIPFELRDSVWTVLQELVHDAVPSLAYEKKYANGRRYGTLSINTIRGEAMHMLFAYADWVRRHQEPGSGANPAKEILEPLRDHLDTDKEPTLTIRSTYSQHLGWLYHFHREWLLDNLERIFPRAPELKDYRDVAWETYVTYCRPWLPLFKLLVGEYAHAVSNISQRRGEDEQYDLQHPDDALAEHMIQLYWQNEISIDDPQSLISHFFEKAPEKTRVHAIDFAGRAVWNTTGEIPKEILTRLQHLFDIRLEAAKANGIRNGFEKELCAFGTWVQSRRFDEVWTLRSLEEMLTLTKAREPFGGLILEPLAEMSRRFPLEAVRCLSLMISRDQERLSWYAEPEQIKTILRSAMARDEKAKEIAVAVQDILLRQGWFEFRILA